MPECLCKNCAQRLEFDEEAIGAEVQCPTCGQNTVLRVPEVEAASTEAVAKPEAEKPGSTALIKCRDCGGVVSRRANACPHCGAPLHSRRRAAYIAGSVVAGLVIIGGAFILFSAPPKTSKKSERPKPQATQPVPPPAQIDTGVLVEGTVFVVTQGKETVKLGAVPITAFDEESFQAYKRAILPKVQSTRQQILAAAGQHSQSRVKLYKTGDELDRKADRFSQEAARLRSISGEFFGMREYQEYDQYKTLAISSNTVAKKIRGEFINTNDQSIAASEKALEILGTMPAAVAACYVSELPSPLVSTKTDLDGKFLLKLPKPGRYVLAAQAKRPVGGKESEFIWLVNLTLEGNSTKLVFLSSDNLLTSHSDQSAVNVFE
jgi:predicted RNA-binding Zn-ribbon protein involved in translation (DUF1610 family)